MKFQVGVSISLSLSAQAFDVLSQLSKKGIYGRTPEEVAERMLDETLRDFVVVPVFAIKGDTVKEIAE